MREELSVELHWWHLMASGLQLGVLALRVGFLSNIK